jgi:acetyl-CoA acetyltransferase
MTDACICDGIRPVARVESAAAAGVEPCVMGLGPVPASKKELERAGLSLAAVLERVQ